MIDVFMDGGKPIKNWASILEDEARQQLIKLSKLPFIHSHVAVMPDAHAGKGSTVGTVIATRGAIIPAAVGVDIGCGMMATRFPFKIEDLGGDAALKELRSNIERAIPTGRHGHKNVTDAAQYLLVDLRQQHPRNFTDKLWVEKITPQMGTLGGGNHFIEICYDQEGVAWLMLHSGSRYIGKHLAEQHINAAKGLMKKYFIDVPDPDLAYLVQDTPEFERYMADLEWAQQYAKYNRQVMSHLACGQIMRHYLKLNPSSPFTGPTALKINCHHNYTNIENHNGKNVYVTRKGAVSARKGEYGIIPGSMGTKSYIVKGRGNPDSFDSCSHGAGRIMSRTKARANFTAEDLARQTEGVECRKDSAVVDEIPGAYKPIEQVMADQADLVEVVFTLKQVLCIKGE